ncbi:VOC family protein [Rhizobium glycinendophyticum]|uniref:Glyoxalase n=1 Tax=Rhizobium glycinendophyticum TaxID=2589807 RepID=A0A504U961_9HYPH|nr:VOC family protein [Rhizobium glycinendophyticum]TPP10047.1 glyoxalase [Rhizobium glycinendophyticum]
MALLGLHHVHLAMPSGGEDQARAFYGDVLGLVEVQKPENLARRGGCWFELGDLRIHLGVEEEFRAARKAHPALLVDNLAGLTARIDAAGFQIVSDEPLLGFERLYVYDPFGNRIELMQAVG